MSNSVFFSVLLPTKNRSHLVGTAIKSVLDQSFTDFELIIADNDDDPEATKSIVESFDDPRIVYLRTGDLSMVENWEVARKSANGLYVTVLEDKLAYYQNTLQTLNDVYCQTLTDIVTWKWNIRPKFKNLYDLRYVSAGGFSSVSTKEIIKAYISGKQHLRRTRIWHLIPRMINSCVSSRLIDEIMQATEENSYFSYRSPDLTSGFKQLFCADRIYFTRKRLGYYSSTESTGRLMGSDKNASQKYFSGSKIVDHQLAVENVPFKIPTLIDNSIYSDYLSVKNKFGFSQNDLVMPKCTYALMCYKEVSRKIRRKKKRKENREIMAKLEHYVSQNFQADDKRCYRIKKYLVRFFGRKLIR